jgi:HlyD family secretion protein
LRFAAFNQRTTPEINGVVSRISADIALDQKTGMPVEAFVQTDTRTVMSYLLKPLHDQIAKAFRER